MKLSQPFLILTLFALLGLLAACQPAGNEPEVPATRAGDPTPTAEPAGDTQGEGELDPAVMAAQEALVAALGVNLEQIENISFEQREWPDACLGLPEQGEMCAQVLTPGFLVTLEADGETYHVRTNIDGSTIRTEELQGGAGPGPESYPPAVEAARTKVAAEQGLEAAAIAVTSFEETTWSDSCLGWGEANETCAQVETPGYLVILNAGGRVYEARTNQDGTAVRYRETANPATELPAAAVNARQALAQRLSVDTGAVDVLSFEQREWRDSCLGLGGPNEMCAQVITPGFLVRLNAEGQTYEAHTDRTGTAVRFAGGQAPLGERPAGAPIVVLQQSGGITGEVVEWRLYANGRAEKVLNPSSAEPVVETGMVPDPRQLPTLLDDLQTIGFFELDGDYMPKETCCDRYHYTLSASLDGQSNTIETLESTDNLPPAVWESIDRVQSLMSEIFPEPVTE